MKSVVELESLKQIKNINSELVSVFKPLQETIRSIYTSETIINIQSTLSSFAKILENQNEIIKTATASIRLDWIKDISEIMNNTITSLGSLPNFSSLDLNMNLQSILAKDTGYLVRSTNDSYDFEAFDESIAVKINKIGIDIFEILSKIKFLDDDIHKNTSDGCKNIAYIVGNIATNDKDFSQIINACYELFYEGFGGNNLRTISYVPFDDYPALFDIKNIRLSYNHDIEHGSAPEIRKKKDKIAGIYTKFIGKEIPLHAKDFKKCQYELYLEIRDWLSAVLDKMNTCN